MSPDLQSTIGRELRENYALQLMDELTFVKILTEDQPFIPKYFGKDVEMNKKRGPGFFGECQPYFEIKGRRKDRKGCIGG